MIGREKSFKQALLGDGFNDFLNFSAPKNWGFMIQFDEHIFSDGVVQPPT